MSGDCAGLLLDWACQRTCARERWGREKPDCSLARAVHSALHPEKPWFPVNGRGFNSRHLHHLCSHTRTSCQKGPAQAPGPSSSHPGGLDRCDRCWPVRMVGCCVTTPSTRSGSALATSRPGRRRWGAPSPGSGWLSVAGPSGWGCGARPTWCCCSPRWSAASWRSDSPRPRPRSTSPWSPLTGWPDWTTPCSTPPSGGAAPGWTRPSRSSRRWVGRSACPCWPSWPPG